MQFDEEIFFQGTMIYKRGYYDYREDGFGPVFTNLEDSVHAIGEYMEKEMQVPELYRMRAATFFAFHDQHNSERVYEKICQAIEDTGK